MTTFDLLTDIGLNADDCIVIGSGILSASGIRQSRDIDVVTDAVTYRKLSKNGRFTEVENHGRPVLTDDLFEIGTSWGVLGNDLGLNDLVKESVIVDRVRYISLPFLLRVKQSWLQDADVRQKDIDDVRLIQSYLADL